MNKKQAGQKFYDRIYEATEILEDLAKEGRLKHREGKVATLEDARELRIEFAKGAKDFLESAWRSFDAPVSDDKDSGDADTGDGTSGDASNEGGGANDLD